MPSKTSSISKHIVRQYFNNLELNQIRRFKALQERYKEQKESLNNLREIIIKEFSLRPPELKEANKVHEAQLREETRQKFGLFYIGKYDHELQQTIDIKTLLNKVRDLEIYSDVLFDFINHNKESLVLTKSLVKSKVSEDNPIWRWIEDSGLLNQGEQNRFLTEIEKNLNRISQIEFDTKIGFTTALHSMIKLRNQKIIHKLFMLGADVNIYIDGKNALEVALQDSDSFEIIELILSKCSIVTVNTQLSNNQSPLEYVYTNNEIDLLEKLTKLKATTPVLSDKSALSCQGPTLLHKAVCDAKINAVKAIAVADMNNLNLAISNEPKVNSKISFFSWFFTIGTTPLHLALDKYQSTHTDKDTYLDIAQILLTNNARINIPGNDGLTVYQKIQQDPELRSNEDLIKNIKNKDSENYMDKAVSNIWLQYGHIIGNFFVAPAIKCANQELTNKIFDQQQFYQCYSSKLNSNHAISSLKTPAIILASQAYVAPAYTMLGIKIYDISVSKQPLKDVFYSIAGYTVNAVLAYHLGSMPLVKDSPFLTGMLLPAIGPLMELGVSAINEGYQQLMGDSSREVFEL